jgi:magnesium-transporting ATPase (P-type)
LLESRDLFVNQALLTGEPYPAEKHASDAPWALKTRPEHRTPYLPAHL